MSWRKNAVSIGRKSDSGVVTLYPGFQGHYNISAGDQATLIINRVTEADDAVFACSVQTSVKVWVDNIQVKVGGELILVPLYRPTICLPRCFLVAPECTCNKIYHITLTLSRSEGGGAD